MAVNPDRELLRVAREEGWEVLRFDRLGWKLKALGGVAATLLGGGAVTAVAVRRRQ